MKFIKKVIIILIILVIIIISMIIGLKYKKNNDQEKEIQKEIENADQGLYYEDNSNGFQILKDQSIFYTIMNIVNDYLQVLAYDDENTDILNNPYGIVNINQQKEIILDMLDKDYIDENNIKNDFRNKIEFINYEFDLTPIAIKVKYEEDIVIYIVNIYLENLENNKLEEKYYIIRLDNQNGAFSIEPISKKYNSIDDVSVKVYENIIEKNDYNNFKIETVSVEGLVKIYMQHFIKMSINHPDIIYNNYIDKEYRDKRFGSLDEFKEYIQANKDAIEQIKIKKYLSENEGEKTKYVLMDMYENTYEFYEVATMDYKVKLDTYTILTDKFKETYSKSDDKKKVQMNVDKFIQMINRHDYKTSYNCISNGFKNNYFDTQEKFERYIKSAFFEHNKFEFKSIEQSGNNIYICTLDITDLTGNNSEKRTIKIIMKLNDNFDFEISFGN